MFKSINKIGGYIKVSRYTKIHLALKKFQPPWTHKAIQAWMHPFWLKKISSVLCWGTGTGCAKPIFDTQIISNRKYSNPLFPLTMLWFRETETQWWKEQVCGRQYKWESLISGHPTTCEHRWPGNIHGHKRLSKLRVHEGGLGGCFFLLSIRVWFKVCRIEQKDCSRPSWAGLLKGSCYEWVSRGRWAEPTLGLCPGCASISPGPWRYIPSKLSVLILHRQRGGKENLTKAENWEKRKKSGCLNLALYRTTLGSGWSPLQTLWGGLLLDSLVWSLWIYSSKSISSIMPMIL